MEEEEVSKETEENPLDKYERQPKEEEISKKWDKQGPDNG